MGRWFDLLARLTIAAVVAAAILVLPGTGGAASIAQAANCPSAPVTVGKLANIDGATGLDCYGGQLLTFRAFLPRPDGIGGTSTYWISPAWLDDFKGSWVYLGTSQRAASVVAFVPPALGRCLGPTGSTCPFRTYAGHWVTVQAHFDGPVAQTCRYHGQHLGKGMTKRAAIEDCRQRLIVLSVGPDTLPATDTVAGQRPAPADRPAIALGTAFLVGLVAVARRRPRRIS